MSSRDFDWANAIESRLPEPFVLAVWAAIFLAEAVVLVVHLHVTGARLMLFHVYPFVWINLGIWAVWRTSPPQAPKRTRNIATAVAAGYFLVLAYFGGLLREGHAFHDHGEIPIELLATGFSVHFELPPGYGPALTYSGEFLISSLSPYLLVGFLALAYLMYVTILDASGEASIGLVGLFSCVGCSFPLIAALVSGGAATSLAAFVYSQAYALSTVAFVLTVLFLYWRPFEAADVRSTLLAVGFGLVALSGTIHLGLGLSGLLEVATTGTGQLAGSAAFLGVALLAYLAVGGYATGQLPPRPALSLGTGLMIVVFVLYFDWHVVGTLETLLPLESLGLEHDHGHGHDHDHGGFLAQAGEHLREDAAALVSKSAELLAIIFLGSVLFQEWVDENRY